MAFYKLSAADSKAIAAALCPSADVSSQAKARALGLPFFLSRLQKPVGSEPFDAPLDLSALVNLPAADIANLLNGAHIAQGDSAAVNACTLAAHHFTRAADSEQRKYEVQQLEFQAKSRLQGPAIQPPPPPPPAAAAPPLPLPGANPQPPFISQQEHQAIAASIAQSQASLAHLHGRPAAKMAAATTGEFSQWSSLPLKGYGRRAKQHDDTHTLTLNAHGSFTKKVKPDIAPSNSAELSSFLLLRVEEVLKWSSATPGWSVWHALIQEGFSYHFPAFQMKIAKIALGYSLSAVWDYVLDTFYEWEQGTGIEFQDFPTKEVGDLWQRAFISSNELRGASARSSPNAKVCANHPAATTHETSECRNNKDNSRGQQENFQGAVERRKLRRKAYDDSRQRRQPSPLRLQDSRQRRQPSPLRLPAPPRLSIAPAPSRA